MADNWTDYSLSGCIFESVPTPGPSLKVPDVRLPDYVDLRAHCSPIENQRHTSSCVANAVVGALEFHQRRAGLPVTDLSRLFVYYNARALADKETEDCGSLIHHGMAALIAHGACEERMWPFLEAMLKVKPTQGAYRNAAHYEAVQYARTPLGPSALAVLSQGLPVVFGTYAPKDYFDVAHVTGKMPHTNQIVPKAPPSGHAMLMVGYDLAEQCWLVRNSWGPAWADQGYCWIPFDTLEAWSDPTSFWTIGAIEQTAGFSLQGPSMAKQGRHHSLTPESDSSLSDMRSEIRSSLSDQLGATKQNIRDRLRKK